MGSAVERRIGALKPGYYTRIGAAVRHASAQLVDQPQRKKLLLVLTDGKPNDVDHYEGPLCSRRHPQGRAGGAKAGHCGVRRHGRRKRAVLLSSPVRARRLRHDKRYRNARVDAISVPASTAAWCSCTTRRVACETCEASKRGAGEEDKVLQEAVQRWRRARAECSMGYSFTNGAQPAQTNAGGFARCASTARVLGIKCSRNGDKSSCSRLRTTRRRPVWRSAALEARAARPAVESQQVILPELEAADLLAIQLTRLRRVSLLVPRPGGADDRGQIRMDGAEIQRRSRGGGIGDQEVGSPARRLR